MGAVCAVQHFMLDFNPNHVTREKTRRLLLPGSVDEQTIVPENVDIVDGNEHYPLGH